MQILHFYYWKECADFLAAEDCEMVGFCVSQPHAQSISSEVSSSGGGLEPVPIYQCTFLRSACFFLGPKVLLTAEMDSVCQRLVYVPLPQPQLEHYVHPNAKLSICLQHFAQQAGFAATGFSGGKHIVGASPAPCDGVSGHDEDASPAEQTLVKPGAAVRAPRHTRPRPHPRREASTTEEGEDLQLTGLFAALEADPC
eukprot:gene35601-43176_t